MPPARSRCCRQDVVRVGAGGAPLADRCCPWPAPATLRCLSHAPRQRGSGWGVRAEASAWPSTPLFSLTRWGLPSRYGLLLLVAGWLVGGVNTYGCICVPALPAAASRGICCAGGGDFVVAERLKFFSLGWLPQQRTARERPVDKGSHCGA